MMLSSVEFIGVFMIVLALMLWSLWCDRKQQQETEVEDVVEAVVPGLYWYDGNGVHELWDAETIALRDELVAEVLEHKGRNGYAMYLLKVTKQFIWLADEYVADGVITPVTEKEWDAHKVPTQSAGYWMYRIRFVNKDGEDSHTTWCELNVLSTYRQLTELDGGTCLTVEEEFFEY